MIFKYFLPNISNIAYFVHCWACLTTAIWRCCKNSSQWQCSFQCKLRSHWLKFLWQFYCDLNWILIKVATILQMSLSNAFYWMKIFAFRFKFHGSMFLGVTQQVRIGYHNGLMLNRQQGITWTNDDPVHWCIYGSPGPKFIEKIW